MNKILAAVLAGFIIVVTQSGSVVVVGNFSDQDTNSRPPAINGPIHEPFAHHALLRTESSIADARTGTLQLKNTGPRRGPVK